MRLVVHLREIIRKAEWSKAEAIQRTGINKDTIDKLQNNRPDWSLKKRQVHKLMVLAEEFGLENGPFELLPHEIWNTYHQSTVCVVRCRESWDAGVENLADGFLRPLGSKGELKLADADIEIAELMKTRNCIFIGSPKANPLTEEALALLVGAKPFSPTETNRAKFPFQMIGSSDVHRGGDRKSSVLLYSTAQPSIRLKVGAAEKRLAVSWYPEDEFEQASDRSVDDAAAVVVCRQPLGTTKDVSSICICGYTGLATHEAARALMFGEPPIAEEELVPGEPITLGFSFKFRKIKRIRKRSRDDLRRSLAGRDGHRMWHVVREDGNSKSKKIVPKFHAENATFEVD